VKKIDLTSWTPERVLETPGPLENTLRTTDLDIPLLSSNCKIVTAQQKRNKLHFYSHAYTLLREVSGSSVTRSSRWREIPWWHRAQGRPRGYSSTEQRTAGAWWRAFSWCLEEGCRREDQGALCLPALLKFSLLKIEVWFQF
jgi:hypothetical protein